jgi:hypothetical protein
MPEMLGATRRPGIQPVTSPGGTTAAQRRPALVALLLAPTAAAVAALAPIGSDQKGPKPLALAWVCRFIVTGVLVWLPQILPNGQASRARKVPAQPSRRSQHHRAMRLS